MDGWNSEKIESLTDVLNDIQGFKYELDNCIRGCRTDCHTYKELANLMRETAERLNDAAHDLDYVEEDEEDYEGS